LLLLLLFARFPPKSKSSPWLNPPPLTTVLDSSSIPPQDHLHKSELIEKSRFGGDPQMIPKSTPSTPVVQPPYLNTIPGRGPIWPNYSTENKPVSPWTNDPSTSIWYNGPVTQASSNPWKSMTTTEESSGGGWKPISSSISPEQQQQRSLIQEEQNKTLREIVAQMNQVKNNPISTLVGLENKEEPNSRDELKQSRINIYPEQDRSAVQQQQQSYTTTTPKQLLQQLQHLQLQQQQQLQLQQLQLQQQQPLLTQSGSAWKTLSSQDIPKSFIDIQKEEEQHKISREQLSYHHHPEQQQQQQQQQQYNVPHHLNESPWGAAKSTSDPTRRDEVKKPTTQQQQQPHDQQQQQQSKRPATQKPPPPHSTTSTGNRNNMKHSK